MNTHTHIQIKLSEYKEQTLILYNSSQLKILSAIIKLYTWKFQFFKVLIYERAITRISFDKLSVLTIVTLH